jgi:hypothetical protein
MHKKIIGALGVLVIFGIGLLVYLQKVQTPDTANVRVIKLHNLAGQRIIVYQIQRADGLTDSFADVEPFGIPDEYMLAGEEFVNRPADPTVPSHKRMTDKMIAEFSKLAAAVSRLIDLEAQPWSDVRTDTPQEVLNKTSQNFIPLTEYVYKPIKP